MMPFSSSYGSTLIMNNFFKIVNYLLKKTVTNCFEADLDIS